MHWELWHTESGNLVETFDTEAGGLQGVRDMLAVNRPDVIDELVLGAMYDEGESQEVELPPVLDGEALKARLAETAQASAADAAREVHERIRRWLAEERWEVRDMVDPEARLNVMVTLGVRKQVNILQDMNHVDQIIVALQAEFGQAGRGLIQIPAVAQRKTLEDIERDVAIMGLECAIINGDPIRMVYASVIYFDGLTKDALIQKIRLVLRAFSVAELTIRRVLEDAGHAERMPTNIRHLAAAATTDVFSGSMMAAS